MRKKNKNKKKPCRNEYELKKGGGGGNMVCRIDSRKEEIKTCRRWKISPFFFLLLLLSSSRRE